MRSRRGPLAAGSLALGLALGLTFGLNASVPASHAQRGPILAAPAGLAPGDWVFRGGTSSDSRWIRALSDSAFSHVGIVVQTQPHILIAHATTDDDPANRDRVILSHWEAFASAALADRLAVARPRFMNADQRKASAGHVAARVGERFSLTDRASAPLYCTTLLVDAVQTQTDFNPGWQQLDLPVLGGEYLFPKALAEADLHWLSSTHPQ